MGKTAIEKAQEDIGKVYAKVRGLYPEYEKVVNEYQEILRSEAYNDDYKLKKKEETLEKIDVLKDKYTDRGLEELDKIADKYNPKPEPEELSETERLTKVMVYKDILQDLPKEELQELYINYGHDQDIKALFDNASRNDSNISFWIEEVKNPDKTQFDELIEKHRKMITTIKGSIKDHITVVDETGRFTGMRNISNDLNTTSTLKFSI